MAVRSRAYKRLCISGFLTSLFGISLLVETSVFSPTLVGPSRSPISQPLASSFASRGDVNNDGIKSVKRTKTRSIHHDSLPGSSTFRVYEPDKKFPLKLSESSSSVKRSISRDLPQQTVNFHHQTKPLKPVESLRLSTQDRRQFDHRNLKKLEQLDSKNAYRYNYIVETPNKTGNTNNNSNGKTNLVNNIKTTLYRNNIAPPTPPPPPLANVNAHLSEQTVASIVGSKMNALKYEDKASKTGAQILSKGKWCCRERMKAQASEHFSDVRWLIIFPP